MKKSFGKLEKELREREKKYHKNFTFFDTFVVSISTGTVILKILNDSQIYFYSNYGYISLFGGILMCIFLCYFVTKNVELSTWYYFSMPILILTLSLWIIPKFFHYIILAPNVICIESTITNKYWHRYGDVGYIEFNFDNNSNIPKKLLHFNSLSKLSKYNYDIFPSKGAKIKICGDISKVGYTYTHIEAIK